MREKSQRWLSLWTTTVAGALITNQKTPPCALLVASKRTRDWLPGTNSWNPRIFAGRRRSVAVN